MPTAPPAYAGVAAGSPRSPRRWPWVVGAVLVVLVLGASGGYLVTRDEDSSDVATDRGANASEGDSGSASHAPSPQQDESDGSEDDPETAITTTPSPSASAHSVGALCWDGSEAPTVADCSRPQGLAGLEFVFPTLSGQSCSDITTPEQRGMGRKILIQCFAYLPDGTEIRINYSQWASVSAGYAHYDSQGLTRSEMDADNGDVLLYQWVGLGVSGEYKAAGLYGQEPYSSSLYAPTSAARDEALATLISARPVDQVRGQPVD